MTADAVSPGDPGGVTEDALVVAGDSGVVPTDMVPLLDGCMYTDEWAAPPDVVPDVAGAGMGVGAICAPPDARPAADVGICIGPVGVAPPVGTAPPVDTPDVCVGCDPVGGCRSPPVAVPGGCSSVGVDVGATGGVDVGATGGVDVGATGGVAVGAAGGVGFVTVVSAWSTSRVEEKCTSDVTIRRPSARSMMHLWSLVSNSNPRQARSPSCLCCWRRVGQVACRVTVPMAPNGAGTLRESAEYVVVGLRRAMSVARSWVAP